MSTEKHLPLEVAEAFEHATLFDRHPTTNIVYFAKSEKSRGDAWAEVHGDSKAGNPWRKLHTKDYWVWYTTAETEDAAKRKTILSHE